MSGTQHLGEDLLNQVRETVYRQTGEDLSGFQPAVVERRLRFRLAAQGERDPYVYVRRIAQDPAECRSLADACLISHSHFFRNPSLWLWLGSEGLEQLQNLAGNRRIRCWSAACGRGQEPFSLMMLFVAKAGLEAAKFVATDWSERALESLRRAVFQEEEIALLPFAYVQRFFERCGRRSWRIKAEYRRLVASGRHDLTIPGLRPPHTMYDTFHLIFCRNVTMFYTDETRLKIFRSLWQRLEPGGLLVIGRKERLPAAALPGARRVVPMVWRKDGWA